METENTMMTEEKQRPNSLKILCILSFIGVGLMLLSSAINFNQTFIKTAEQKAIEREQTYEMMLQAKPEMADQMIQAMVDAEQYAAATWTIGFVCNLITLVGVILMWKMKMNGYYLYLTGELLPWILPFLFAGGMASFKALGGMLGPAFAGILMGLMIVQDIIFLVLYTLNRKHLS